MSDTVNFLIKSLIKYLEGLKYQITHANIEGFDLPPDINGYRPDAVGNLKGLKICYGIALLPDKVMDKDTWDKLKALSWDNEKILYIAFPEKEKQWLILSLINGKLAEKRNIHKVYF